MQVTSRGSVRVDLVGGTLDLEPINLILPNVVTLNVATSLMAEVTISDVDQPGLTIISKDYDKEYFFPKEKLTESAIVYSDQFEEMQFILQILNLFNLSEGLQIELSSGAPAGSGLGGSSAMGMTLFKALCQYKGVQLNIDSAVQMVKGVEGRILNQGIPGYQDYYPAVVGGVLALRGIPGSIQVEQLFDRELKAFLESHITLIYSGISRSSGINNWEVYKKFFDRDQICREAMGDIAKVSFEFYQHLKDKNYNDLLRLIGEEGAVRKKLADTIVPQVVEDFFQGLHGENLAIGMKMCGAGGGGCFIVTHQPEHKTHIQEKIRHHQFQELEFSILEPL